MITIKIATDSDVEDLIKLKQKVILDTYLLPEYGITEAIIIQSFEVETPNIFLNFMKSTKYVVAFVSNKLVGMCEAWGDGVIRGMYSTLIIRGKELVKN